MKLSFVTPRCGEDIVGGAEHAVMMLADNCQRYGGCDVEILTTTAADERTWTPGYDEGHDTVGSLQVRRFSNNSIDRQHFDSWALDLLARPEEVDDRVFDEWLRRQGPYSPGLLDAIANSDADALVFHPMLSSPTSHGVFRAKKPVIIHPALHEEPLSYMPGYKKVIERADLLAFSTRSEQKLSHRIHSSQMAHQSVIGFGIDTPDKISSSRRKEHLQKYSLSSRNFAVVIGRVDRGKGSHMCAEMFCSAYPYLQGVDTLVFIGPISEPINTDKNIVCTGSISDEEKWSLLSNARCLISPSVTESFSLVVLEAMKLSVPVIVNGYCDPTREHVSRSSSGASFGSFGEFIAALNICSIDSPTRDSMIENGKDYIEKYYEWESVIGRYIDVVSEVVSRTTSS